ncbi:MAG TPA: epoxide hydrolase [Vicinamibacterales bacterium]|jgi:pimeloyl-ACP methyl ester carboxylesterase
MRRGSARTAGVLVIVALAVTSLTLIVGASPQAPAAPRGASDSTAIVPFKINVPEDVLVDLKQRLARARFPDEVEGAAWNYGTNLAYLKQLVAYWRDKYDWRAAERRLNQFEQFKTTIDGLNVHFIWRKSKERNALPLLVTHGWPGSVVEFTKIIPPLTDPVAHGGRAEDAFDVVAPSIPGYGFSDKPRTPGYGPTKMAEIEAKLMARLGYSRYGAQGGDWGALITPSIAMIDKAHVAGIHLNMCTAGQPAGVTDPMAGLTAAEQARMKERQHFQTEETGYSTEQGTKPQTIGAALNDSPVGLAAWIVEKFHTWCDCNGDPESVFTRDELLTNITLYWVTQTAASSARLYYESRHGGNIFAGRVEVPTACAQFPKEIIWAPRKWVEARYNLKRWTEFPRGGHFAALEQPDALVGDVRAFFRDLRSAPAASK